MATLDRISGTLLGTALGDALGLASEGMSARAIARRFGRVDRFHRIGRTGFVSDDTDRPRSWPNAWRSIRTMPYSSRVPSVVLCWAGSAVCPGAWDVDHPSLRRIGPGPAPQRGHVGRERGRDAGGDRRSLLRSTADPTREVRSVLAEVTAATPAQWKAPYVAELAAALPRSPPGTRPEVCQEQARHCVTLPALGEAIDLGPGLGPSGMSTRDAALRCGTSGFVVHSVSFATFGLLRYGSDPLLALTEVINAGGDTDLNGAILGSWLGALHGEAALPQGLMRGFTMGRSARLIYEPWPDAWGKSATVDRHGCRATRRHSLGA